VRRFVHHSDSVVVKEDVLREKRGELRTRFRDRKFRLVVLNFYGAGQGEISRRFHSVHVYTTKIKALIPRRWLDMRKPFMQKLKK
jgi:hypothetical protein